MSNIVPSSEDTSVEELAQAVEMGFDRHFAADLWVPKARIALGHLVEYIQKVEKERDEWKEKQRLVQETASANLKRGQREYHRAKTAEQRVRELEVHHAEFIEQLRQIPKDSAP